MAWRAGLIDDESLAARGKALAKSGYGHYLTMLLEEEGSKDQEVDA